LYSGKERFSHWQPSDWAEPGNPFLPKYQLGSLLPYAIVATHLSIPNSAPQEFQAWEYPVCCHHWITAGKLHVLTGNLETAVLGDSRVARQIHYYPDKSQMPTAIGKLVLQRIDQSGEPDILSVKRHVSGHLHVLVDVDPEGAAVYILESAKE
jgi:hypothetical protein